MLKGPTGCGKTRFVEHMAWRLKRPLVTVSCHDDLSASDLVGRFLMESSTGPYLAGRPADPSGTRRCEMLSHEVVEARQDTVVVFHPLTDYRRILPLDKTGAFI